MRTINTENYGPATLDLLARATAAALPRSLNFAAPDTSAESALRAITDQTISKSRRVRMPHDAQALHAALWLLFDFMKESHDISQQIATPSGSYWHGMLHRREPDAFNAKYWMARVGEHPIFPELLADARELTANVPALSDKFNAIKSWDANWLVDQCCSNPTGEIEQALLQIQRREWSLLFDYNFSKAFA